MKFPEPLYYSNIRLLWLARFFASAGSFFQFVVIGWLTYEYTQSRFLTSLSWGIGALAGVISAPIGGFAADKWERQKVIVYVFLMKSICVFVFAYLVISNNFNTGSIFIFLLLLGFIQSLSAPSDFSLIPLLVPARRNIIFGAYAIAGSAYFVGHFTIPYFAGLILQEIGPGWTLIGQLILFLMAVFIYYNIKTIVPQARMIKYNLKENYLELLNFLKTNRLLQGAILLRTTVNVLVVPSVHGLLPIYSADSAGLLTTPVSTAEEFDALLDDERKNAVLVGPGAGVNRTTRDITLATLGRERATVLDADALTVFADDPEALYAATSGARCLLTPHEGEFRRIFNVEGDKLSRTREAAATCGAVVLLKGADSVIAAPDGRAVINGNAPPELATAGTGDVLAGLAVGLMAQGVDPFEAGCAAVWLQGDAASEFGPGLIAEDLSEMLPRVLRRLWTTAQ